MEDIDKEGPLTIFQWQLDKVRIWAFLFLKKKGWDISHSKALFNYLHNFSWWNINNKLKKKILHPTNYYSHHKKVQRTHDFPSIKNKRNSKYINNEDNNFIK